MTDIFTKAQRSQIMSHIRSVGNRETELRLADIFRRNSITGWRRHQGLPGTPDFAFRHERLAVFVDGCFWHGCPQCYRRPTSHQEYWDAKLCRNRFRDREANRALKRGGWRVVRIWSHQLKNETRVVCRIRRALAKI